MPALGAVTTPLPQFNLERLDLNPSAADTLSVSGGALLPVDTWRVALALDYEKDPLYLYNAGTKLGAVVSERLTANVLAAWAPLKRLELGLVLPVVAYQKGDDLSAEGVQAPTTTAVSSPLLGARLGIQEQRLGDSLDLAAQVQLGFPLGQPASLSNDRTLTVYPKLMAGRDFDPFRLGGEVGVLIRPTVSFGSETFGTQLDLAAVASMKVAALRLEVEGRGQIPFSGASSEWELLGGVNCDLFSWFSVFALAGPGLGQAPGTPTYRVLAGLAYRRGAP
jgi:hypothetical protein